MKTSATGCSVEEAMRLLGGRWRLLLVSYLLDGPRRFSDLRRDMPGISQRMLTLDLRALEDAELCGAPSIRKCRCGSSTI